MIQRLLPLASLLSALLLAGCGKQAGKPAASGGAPALATVDQRVSYGIGHNLGRNLARDKVLKLDRAALEAGLADGLAQAQTRVAESDLEAAFTALQQRAKESATADAEKQLAAGKAYLEQNQKKPGVKVTDSGLQYEVLKSGNGPKPKATDTVKVHYHGTLIDGTVFDSSIQRNEPIEFPVGGVIKGWVEALQLMSVGDKWRLTIPAELAYGARAAGEIPANSVLVFEVELLEIK